MTTTAAAPEFCLPGLVRNAVQSLATVVEHEPMAKGTWRMRLACPEIARQILPGQFFMIRMPGRSDPLLGRPFALYDVYGTEPEGIDFGYVVVGKMTSLFGSLKPGDRVELWGQHLPVETIASAAGTIAYELICQVSPRVQNQLKIL